MLVNFGQRGWNLTWGQLVKGRKFCLRKIVVKMPKTWSKSKIPMDKKVSLPWLNVFKDSIKQRLEELSQTGSNLCGQHILLLKSNSSRIYSINIQNVSLNLSQNKQFKYCQWAISISLSNLGKFPPPRTCEKNYIWFVSNPNFPNDGGWIYIYTGKTRWALTKGHTHSHDGANLSFRAYMKARNNNNYFLVCAIFFAQFRRPIWHARIPLDATKNQHSLLAMEVFSSNKFPFGNSPS